MGKLYVNICKFLIKKSFFSIYNQLYKRIHMLFIIATYYFKQIELLKRENTADNTIISNLFDVLLSPKTPRLEKICDFPSLSLRSKSKFVCVNLLSHIPKYNYPWESRFKYPQLFYFGRTEMFKSAFFISLAMLYLKKNEND